jgi:hypothetical protein
VPLPDDVDPVREEDEPVPPPDPLDAFDPLEPLGAPDPLVEPDPPLEPDTPDPALEEVPRDPLPPPEPEPPLEFPLSPPPLFPLLQDPVARTMHVREARARLDVHFMRGLPRAGSIRRDQRRANADCTRTGSMNPALSPRHPCSGTKDVLKGPVSRVRDSLTNDGLGTLSPPLVGLAPDDDGDDGLEGPAAPSWLRCATPRASPASPSANRAAHDREIASSRPTLDG